MDASLLYQEGEKFISIEIIKGYQDYRDFQSGFLDITNTAI